MLLIYLDIRYQLGHSRTAAQAGSNGGSWGYLKRVVPLAR
jgi:hypothetical protein